MRCLKDLDALLDETTEATWEGKANTKDTLYALAERYEFILQRLGSDIAQVHAPSGVLAQLRIGLGSWFGSFSRGYEPRGEAALVQFSRLLSQSERLAASLRNFGANQSHLVDSINKMHQTGRALASTLRSRGHDEFAEALSNRLQSLCAGATGTIWQLSPGWSATSALLVTS